MGTLGSELILDLCGVLAMLLAYLRASFRDRSTETRASESRAAKQADRQYIQDHPKARTAFIGALIGFAAGGFFVAVSPSSSGQQQVVHIGLFIQVASVLAMAIGQMIKGRTIRAAVRSVEHDDDS